MDKELNFFQVHQKRRKSKQQQPALAQEKVSSSSAALAKSSIGKQRISTDQIIPQESQSQELVQSITCPICLLLLQIPYFECQGCSNGFCIECIEGWWKKNQSEQNSQPCVFKCENNDFKLIKRSNTYNAVISTLKIKCEHCLLPYSLGELPNHLAKNCEQFEESCRYCFDSKIKRKNLKEHEQQKCPQRPVQCQHCHMQNPYELCEQHEQSCDEKLVKCENQQCDQNIAKKNYEQHTQNCEHRAVKCQWCENSYQYWLYLKEDHDNKCEKKVIECAWCKIEYGVKEIGEHEGQCKQKKQVCQLCCEFILCLQMKEHRLECMFENLVEIKAKSEEVMKENQSMREKISLLERIIQQNVENRESNTIKVLKEMKEKDRKTIQRDLLRVDNSIKSVQKFNKQEVESHMKFPHLIQSWCPVCRELQKKFKSMMDPLLDNRKEILKKLAELQKYSFTPR